MADFIPSNDREFLVWSQNFLEVATEFQADLGLTPTQIQDIADLIGNFVNDLGTSERLTQQAKIAVHNKNVSHEALEEHLRSLARQYKVKPGLADAILMALRLTVGDKQPTHHAVVTPENVMVHMEADGKVHIEWNSSGNTAGTQYIIEKRKLPAGEYVIIGSTPRRSFTDTTPDSGAPASYRISAQRAGDTSAPSAGVTFGIDS
ncbi:MAG: fibronectin type III domain-containing protein [Bacteroidota bacterium]